jgi:hypothetical protein
MYIRLKKRESQGAGEYCPLNKGYTKGVSKVFSYLIVCRLRTDEYCPNVHSLKIHKRSVQSILVFDRPYAFYKEHTTSSYAPVNPSTAMWGPITNCQDKSASRIHRSAASSFLVRYRLELVRSTITTFYNLCTYIQIPLYEQYNLWCKTELLDTV